MPRLTFTRPLSPSAAFRPPKGDDWLHEPKWDGFRLQVIKDGAGVRIYSRHGTEYTEPSAGRAQCLPSIGDNAESYSDAVPTVE